MSNRIAGLCCFGSWNLSSEVIYMRSVRNLCFNQRHLWFIFWCLVGTFVLGASVTIEAQSTTATIVGTIKDANGAVVPNAHIVVRNLETGLSRNVTSNEEGAYRLEFMPVGNYTLEVTASGFKTA